MVTVAPKIAAHLNWANQRHNPPFNSTVAKLSANPSIVNPFAFSSSFGSGVCFYIACIANPLPQKDFGVPQNRMPNGF
jgi:hypothetical protein